MAESGLTQRTGLTVVGMQQDGRILTNPPPSITLQQGSELFMLGSTDQRQAFAKEFSNIPLV